MPAAIDWSLFDRIYVINLPSREDRRREMESQLQRVRLSFSSPRVKLFSAFRPDSAKGFPTIGTHGCFLSHLGVLRDATGLHRILILEDDLNFSNDFEDHAPAVFEALSRQDWQFFYGANSKRLPHAQATAGLGALPASMPLIGAHFLGLQGDISAVADYLAAMLGRPPGHPLGGPMHVDGAYSRYRADHPEVPSLYACPDLGYQRASRTDIHDLAWYDRMVWARDVSQALRRMKLALKELRSIGSTPASRSTLRPPPPQASQDSHRSPQ